MVMSAPDMTRPGPWQTLFPRALQLMDHLESVTQKPHWTFGGGTVLMLRHNHRQSKDIDLFVPDPQYLGYVNPRISEVAETICADYRAGALFVKLILAAGEIDVVVGPALTDPGYDLVEFEGRQLRVETSAEIIAKKDVAPWQRGQCARLVRSLHCRACRARRTRTGATILQQAWGCIHRSARLESGPGEAGV
jgi:hypothetical protein